MLITTSRNTSLYQKRFCKYLSSLISEIQHIPRGQTPLSKIFEKSSYLGHNFLLIVEKKKENLELVVYKRKDKEFFPDKSFLISEVFYKKTKATPKNINPKGKFFYFLEEKDKDSDIKAIEENQEIKFTLNKELVFSFKILKEESQ
jgi:rRNA maturation protein Rpf1